MRRTCHFSQRCNGIHIIGFSNKLMAKHLFGLSIQNCTNIVLPNTIEKLNLGK